MKSKLWTLNTILVSILLTAAQPILANEQNNCSQKQKDLFTLATQAINLSASLSKSLKTTAIGYDKAGYGPGPGKFAQANYLANVDKKDQELQQILRQAKTDLKALLTSAPECFKDISTEGIIDISTKLAE